MIEPKWLTIARRSIGVREIPGPRHAPGVMAMVGRAAGWLGIRVADDETPWCGTFVAACMADAGFTPPRGFIGVRARAWADWGTPISLMVRFPPLGAIAVFGRTGGGHVGFITGIYGNGDLQILGGNQGNAVNERRFPRTRLVAVRWPCGAAQVLASPRVGGAGVATTGEA